MEDKAKQKKVGTKFRTQIMMKVIQILPELESGGVERGTLEVGQHLVDLVL